MSDVFVEILAAGDPRTQGSMVPFIDRNTGAAREMHADSAELKRWRSTIATAARAAMKGRPPIGDHHPVIVYIAFRIARPLSGRGGVMLDLKAPTQKRDIDKLARAVLDALSGVVFKDDGQVVELSCSKQYAAGSHQPGARITVKKVQVAALTPMRTS